MTNITITLAQLIKAEACQGQAELFKSTFGKSVTVTLPRLLRWADRFDLNWYAANCLPSRKWEVYDKAREEARAASSAARVAARDVYEETCGAAGGTHEKARTEVVAAAQGVYDKACLEASSMYKKARTEALWKALNA